MSQQKSGGKDDKEPDQVDRRALALESQSGEVLRKLHHAGREILGIRFLLELQDTAHSAFRA